MEGDRDPGYLQFRRKSVRIASAVSLAAAAMIAGYLATTWHERPHRGALAVLTCLVVLMVAVIQGARAERLVETRWCDAFFFAWSTAYVVLIPVFALLDGGISSPLTITFFPALVFAGLCYPRWLAVYIGVACVVADVVVGLASPAGQLHESLYIAGLLAITAVMCAWQAHTLDGQRRELARASRTDHLTGALNRRGFHERALSELARARRSGEPLGLVVVDLDGFKRVNDARGHAAGDDLLCWVADRLHEALRPSDAAGRLGGDEFALLLPGLDADLAGAVGERLRAVLGERTAASFGAAAFPEATDADELLAHADAGLYRDKRRARAVELAVPALDLPERFLR